MTKIFLYGPSGSGKSTCGKLLAESLGISAIDLDAAIEEQTGKGIPYIFQSEGEAGFRRIEGEVLGKLVKGEQDCVIMLGGGTLLQQANRELVEAAGPVICLRANQETLLQRLNQDPNKRPLLGQNILANLQALIRERSSHYDSFERQLDTSQLSPEATVYELQVALGRFTIRGMGAGYPVRIEAGSLDRLGEHLCAINMKGPIALVGDSNTAHLYGQCAKDSLQQSGYEVTLLEFPAGEEHKTLATVNELWQGFLQAGLERGSTVVALGGGVVGDLAGFAAATYLRGVAWVNVPTTLLAMVDSSLGGKTGADLPQGKNLIGAFHSPKLVLADPELLRTLPIREVRNGMAETIKHGIIADPALYALCQKADLQYLYKNDTLIRRSVGVKARVIVADPYEKGLRETLNFGHTIGHGVEKASAYRISHGEAVAIGMVAETRLAEKIGLASVGLADAISETLYQNGLPTSIPADLERAQILAAMYLDKKRAAGKIRFALPEDIGKVRSGVIIENWQELLDI
ncbi:3-dehydroquinate synthase [bioreactor metagenome]|uniref:3-dehydroquinate synthase n=1 Tax=bioreactor metagenome TaxID=1076179 RepID=A0A645BBZ7_9ZZZZ